MSHAIDRSSVELSAYLLERRSLFSRLSGIETLSNKFREACRDVISAMDQYQSRDEGEAMHELEAALHQWVRVGNNEWLLHDDSLEVGSC